MAFNYTWKTQDYFDMDPGMRQGMMLRAANQRDREFNAQREDVRENRKQAAVDRAVADRRFEQAKLDALGEATGRMHGSAGIGEPPPELLQNPAYVRGFMIGARERQQADAANERAKGLWQERLQSQADFRERPVNLTEQEMGGKTWVINSRTGKAEPMDDPLPSNASAIRNEEGDVIAYDIGGKLRGVPRSDGFGSLKGAVFGGQTNAPAPMAQPVEPVRRKKYNPATGKVE
ncbi:MAG: hypothetical protein WAT23_19455 [Chromatiaceae bacterium]